jgi:hypothetical protein
MNLGKADDPLMRWYIEFYYWSESNGHIDHCSAVLIVKGQAYFPTELYFAGIVISDGEADPMHGDTALRLTLMIGGKITIMIGHFAMKTNDLVQWCFEEEVGAGMLNDDGLRIPRCAGNNQQPIEYTNPISQEQKKVLDVSYTDRELMKRPAFIKPYSMGMNWLGLRPRTRAAYL